MPRHPKKQTKAEKERENQQWLQQLSTRLMAEYVQLRTERSEYEAEWKQLSDFLLPGRGIYQLYSRPRKRRITSQHVINPAARDALKVLTSGFQGGLTSPARPWFQLEWKDPKVKTVGPLMQWLKSSEDRLYKALEDSNFYQVVHSFYTEFGGFGTAALYMGEDSILSPFRFELLTVGEYAFAVDSRGMVNKFYRTIFLTISQLIDKFGFENLPTSLQQHIETSTGPQEQIYYTVVQAIIPEENKGKAFTSVYMLLSHHSNKGANEAPGINQGDNNILKISGFYEMPYKLGRWELIGSDIYGQGPGQESLPNIKRLQEMEKAFLIAAHKAINPPLNAPAKMKGKLKTLPGGVNYYNDPGQTVTSLYEVRLDYQGVISAVERVEQRLEKSFFNDIFLSASRDPNASPLRTGEVNVKQEEKLLRLGPVIERLSHEVLAPIIERGFNIMLRKGQFEELSPELAEMAGEYNIRFISPLARAQKAIEAQGMERFLQFAGGIAQFSSAALDLIDVDKVVTEYADITGVDWNILRDEKEVKEIRKIRAEQQMAEKKQQQEIQQQGLQLAAEKEKSEIAKNYADAGQGLAQALPGGSA